MSKYRHCGTSLPCSDRVGTAHLAHCQKSIGMCCGVRNPMIRGRSAERTAIAERENCSQAEPGALRGMSPRDAGPTRCGTEPMHGGTRPTPASGTAASAAQGQCWDERSEISRFIAHSCLDHRKGQSATELWGANWPPITSISVFASKLAGEPCIQCHGIAWLYGRLVSTLSNRSLTEANTWFAHSSSPVELSEVAKKRSGSSLTPHPSVLFIAKSMRRCAILCAKLWRKCSGRPDNRIKGRPIEQLIQQPPKGDADASLLRLKPFGMRDFLARRADCGCISRARTISNTQATGHVQLFDTDKNPLDLPAPASTIRERFGQGFKQVPAVRLDKAQ